MHYSCQPLQHQEFFQTARCRLCALLYATLELLHPSLNVVLHSCASMVWMLTSTNDFCVYTVDEVMLNFRDESEVLSELFGDISDPCSWQYTYTSNDTYYDYYDYNYVVTCSQLPDYNNTKVTAL